MSEVKIYSNSTDEDVDVPGVGLIRAGERVSIVSDFHYPVNLTNYPGVEELDANEPGPEKASQEDEDR